MGARSLSSGGAVARPALVPRHPTGASRIGVTVSGPLSRSLSPSLGALRPVPVTPCVRWRRASAPPHAVRRSSDAPSLQTLPAAWTQKTTHENCSHYGRHCGPIALLSPSSRPAPLLANFPRKKMEANFRVSRPMRRQTPRNGSRSGDFSQARARARHRPTRTTTTTTSGQKP